MSQHDTRGSTTLAAAMLTCPHCGLSIRPRAWFLTMIHCPRCLAKRHVAEALAVSPAGPGEPFPVA